MFYLTMYLLIYFCFFLLFYTKMLEPEVDLIIRRQDQTLFNMILYKVQLHYEHKTGKSVQLNIIENKFLDSNVSGGVYLMTPQKHIRLDNSLVTRLNLVSEYLLPQIRNLLFGHNPNRKFSF